MTEGLLTRIRRIIAVKRWSWNKNGTTEKIKENAGCIGGIVILLLVVGGFIYAVWWAGTTIMNTPQSQPTSSWESNTYGVMANTTDVWGAMKPMMNFLMMLIPMFVMLYAVSSLMRRY